MAEIPSMVDPKSLLMIISSKKWWILVQRNGQWLLNIKGLVPPLHVDYQGTNGMSKCIEFEKTY